MTPGYGLLGAATEAAPRGALADGAGDNTRCNYLPLIVGAAAAPKKASRGAAVLSPFAAVAYWRPVTVGLVTNDTEYRYEQ